MDKPVTDAWNAIDKLGNTISHDYRLGRRIAGVFKEYILGSPISEDENIWKKDYEGFWNAIYGLNAVEFRDEVREIIKEDYTATKASHGMVIGFMCGRLARMTGHPDIVEVNNTIASISRGGRIPYFG